MGANDKPLGMIIQAEHARLGNSAASRGATVFAGDSFDTDTGGMLRLSIGSGQIYLAASSAATLTSNSSLAQVVVNRGSLTLASPASGQLEIETPAGILRGADNQAAAGQVTLVSPREMIVSAYRGNLILDNEGELHTIPEGKAYRIVIDQEQGATPVQDNFPQDFHRGKNRKRLAFILIGTGAAVLITYGAWSCLSQSPYKPN
jgi:hypothetical protein